MKSDWPAHLAENEQRALEEMIVRLRRRYGLQLLRVTLFGSKARGDSGKGSDLDVLVVLDVPETALAEHRQQILHDTYDIELARDVVFSILLRSGEAFQQMMRDRFLLARTIDQEGVTLWISTASVPQLS